MSSQDIAKSSYREVAAAYDSYAHTPAGIIEAQLIARALGNDLTGLHVLDLGGGSGIHARECVEYGAESVDIVDISPEMLRVASNMEESLGRKGKIRTFEADVSNSLSNYGHPLRESYDVVMANWVFSHAEKRSILEGMFANIGAYLKPGGIFVGIRDANPFSHNAKTGKYGAHVGWVKKIEGGVKYWAVLHCKPEPVEFEVSSLEIIYGGSTELYENIGLTEYEEIPLESAQCVKDDPEFWADFLRDPFLAVVRAIKA
ncbi:S-adenosyl-L-methionine-dependent methyltransferase [Triangularia verruculosa]|uniref:S-adenosyl-L-methionine-dependent methyltransferase n=1 Tax=Triangularia verruculosa TaxID=2587418 RepID=A0AAN6XGK2_9PEZI|nr:S-adenosyl-L-methionine-dependent methyltransferase [Triangularia verruculosa]